MIYCNYLLQLIPNHIHYYTKDPGNKVCLWYLSTQEAQSYLNNFMHTWSYLCKQQEEPPRKPENGIRMENFVFINNEMERFILGWHEGKVQMY